MPPAIPVIAAIAGAATAAEVGVGLTAFFACDVAAAGAIGALGISAATAGAITAGLAGFAVSTAINAVGSRAFAPGHPGSSLSTNAPSSRAAMVTSTVETHKVIYGQAKVSGPIVYIGTTNSGPTPHGGPMTGTNLMLHMIIALAGHEVEEIGTIYFNDKPVTLNADGYATNLPYPYYPEGLTATTKSIDSAIRTNEVVTVTTSGAHGFTAGDQVTVTTVTDLSMNGDFIILATPSSTTFTYSNGGPNASASGGTAVNNTLSATQNSYARIKKHTGSVSQEADADMVAEVAGWDTAHRLQGIAYVYVRLQYNQEVFGHGIPNISAIVKGKKVYDPRDGTTAWSENTALCIRDYLASDYGFNCSDSEINDTYFSAAANTCDESVALTTGGSQSRYTCNGVLDTANAPIENLNALVAAMAGAVTYVQGQFRGHAGAYDSTGLDITTDMLAGPVKIRTRTPRQQLFNAVQGTYIDPSRKYAATDFPPVVNELYTADDGGTQMFKDIQLPFTNHPEAAQRIAKVVLEQARQGIQLDLVLNHNAISCAVWDTVTYTDSNLGWDHKVFRIKKFSTAGIGPIVLTLQEESSASYDWASGDATVIDAAPDTNLPNPLAKPAVPIGVSYNSRITTATGSVDVYNLVLTWDVHEDAFVINGGTVEIQYKLSADADWRPSFFVNGDQTTADVLSSSINVSYDLRIRAVSALGSRSDWVTITGAVAGYSGGVVTTNDWGNWTDLVGPTNNYGNWTDLVGTTDDWMYFV
ncbi:phage tail protein [Tundrisphaera lichenicola]|uniref:phage tail protein n=1 Tax=Tundrisphaera lichenicola TaxID=2029860 RepID=UPI003EBDCA8A